eukprot:5362106-Prymnesium_polylepis.1
MDPGSCMRRYISVLAPNPTPRSDILRVDWGLYSSSGYGYDCTGLRAGPGGCFRFDARSKAKHVLMRHTTALRRLQPWAGPASFLKK